MYFSRSNEASGSQEDSKKSVLKPAPLKRGRVQKPKPNLGRSVAWKKDHRHEKDPEEEKVEGGEAEGHAIHQVNESNDSCCKNVSFSDSCKDIFLLGLSNKDVDIYHLICKHSSCVSYSFQLNTIF